MFSRSNRFKRLVICGFLCMLGLFSAPPCQAGPVTAATYNGGGTFFNFPDATGYYFTPNVDIAVDRLGYFDKNFTGLATTHDVGIFLTNGTVVVTTTIQAGTGSLLDGHSRYESIGPVTLTAGTHYYANANNNTIDQYVFGTDAVTYAPEITWNGFSQASDNSIFSPTMNLGGVPGNLGPNFQFGPAAVPEPTTWTLAAIGSVVAGGLGWMRRRKAVAA
jgi:hypothetical protein